MNCCILTTSGHSHLPLKIITTNRRAAAVTAASCCCCYFKQANTTTPTTTLLMMNIVLTNTHATTTYYNNGEEGRRRKKQQYHQDSLFLSLHTAPPTYTHSELAAATTMMLRKKTHNNSRNVVVRFQKWMRLVSREIPEPGATRYQNLVRQYSKLTRSRATRSTLRPMPAVASLGIGGQPFNLIFVTAFVSAQIEIDSLLARKGACVRELRPSIRALRRLYTT